MEGKLIQPSRFTALNQLLILSCVFLCNLSQAAIKSTSARPAAHLLNQLSPHVAIYEMKYGDISVGHIRYELTQPKDHHLRFTVESKLGFLLLSDKREIISDFTLHPKNGQIVSRKFQQNRRGTGPDFFETIHFDPKQKKAHWQTKKKTQHFSLSEATYDPLNAQIQLRLDLIQKKPNLSYAYITEKKIERVAFRRNPEDRLNVLGMPMTAEKVEVIRKNNKRQTYLWFTKELNFLPTKIEDAKKGRDAIVAELVYYEELVTSKTKSKTKPLILGKPVGINFTVKKVEKKKRKKHLRK